MTGRELFARIASFALASALLCAAPMGAQAIVIVTSGSFHNGSVSGFADVHDPPVDALPSFADGDTGSVFTTGSASNSFSHAIDLLGGNVHAEALAAFDLTAQIDGIHVRSGSPIVSAGTIDLSASSTMRLATNVATGAGEWAWSRLGATTFSMTEFAVLDEDALLSVRGSLLDRTLTPENVFFEVADTTTGFVPIVLDTDVSNDSAPSTFLHFIPLTKDHVYRMLVSVQVRRVCASTSAPNIANCGEPPSLSLPLVPNDTAVPQSAAGSADYTFTALPEPGVGVATAAGVAALACRRRRLR